MSVVRPFRHGGQLSRYHKKMYSCTLRNLISSICSELTKKIERRVLQGTTNVETDIV